MVIRFLLLLAALMLSAPASAEPYTIIAFGDSFFSGGSLRQDRAFPAKLETALRAKGYDVRVVNLGVSGETSTAGRTRIHQAFLYNPDLALISLGFNDNFARRNVDQTQKNLKFIVETLQYGYVDAMVMGLREPINSKNLDNARAFEKIFTYLAKRYDVPVVFNWLSGVTGNSEFTQSGGIYPNSKGTARLVKTVLPYVESHLKKAGIEPGA